MFVLITTSLSLYSFGILTAWGSSPSTLLRNGSGGGGEAVFSDVLHVDMSFMI